MVRLVFTKYFVIEDDSSMNKKNWANEHEHNIIILFLFSLAEQAIDSFALNLENL